MRNVAAHAHPNIDFDTPQIVNAVQALYEAKHRDLLAVMPRAVLRKMFEAACGTLLKAIAGALDEEEHEREIANLRDYAIERGHLPSRGK